MNSIFLKYKLGILIEDVQCTYYNIATNGKKIYAKITVFVAFPVNSVTNVIPCISF